MVDDRFPYCPHKERWAFSRQSNSNEIWVLIIEKAWAKVFGSYQRIEAGTAGEALGPLTGCPTKYFIHDDAQSKDKLWQTILFADQQKFPMCTAVASQAEEVSGLTHKQMKSVGLVDAHAYSLISAKEIKLKNGKTERILKVRNPWGKKEWTGDWSDSSPLWDDYTKSQVDDFSIADDGMFWISFKDYDLFFYITTICFYKTGYQDSRVADQLDDADEFGLCKLTLTDDAEKTIAITLD